MKQKRLEVCFRELREKSVGPQVSHAPAVSPDEENMLWVSMVISGPLALQRAVFFYIGKVFCGEEQRNLKRSQSDPDCYTYVENGSKNITGANATETNKISSACRARCTASLA